MCSGVSWLLSGVVFFTYSSPLLVAVCQCIQIMHSTNISFYKVLCNTHWYHNVLTTNGSEIHDWAMLEMCKLHKWIKLCYSWSSVGKSLHVVENVVTSFKSLSIPNHEKYSTFTHNLGIVMWESCIWKIVLSSLIWCNTEFHFSQEFLWNS